MEDSMEIPLKTSNKTTMFCAVLSHVQLFATPWTIALQAPLSMGFSRQKYWSGLPLPSPVIYPEETKIEKDTCTPLFIAALFTIARTWKPPIYPSTDNWIKNLWYVHRMEYYSGIKRNTFESVLISWMNLEPIIQNEVN